MIEELGIPEKRRHVLIGGVGGVHLTEVAF